MSFRTVAKKSSKDISVGIMKYLRLKKFLLSKAINYAAEKMTIQSNDEVTRCLRLLGVINTLVEL